MNGARTTKGRRGGRRNVRPRGAPRAGALRRSPLLVAILFSFLISAPLPPSWAAPEEKAPSADSKAGEEKTEEDRQQEKKDKLAGLPEELKKNPSLLFRVALRLHQRGLYRQAIPLLEVFVEDNKDNPNHRRGAYLLADAYFFIAKAGFPKVFQKAAEAFKNALKRYPDAPQMPSAYFRMGESYKALKRPADAQVAYRNILENAPQSLLAPKAQIEIAHTYLQLNDPKSAIIEFQKALKNYKGTASEKDAVFGIAGAYFRQSRFPQALRQFEEGKKRWPNFIKLRPQIFMNYAETLFQVRKFARARTAFLQLINIYEERKTAHRAHARLGDIFLEEGRVNDALKIYARVIKTYPKTEGAWVSLIRMADIGVEKKVEVESGVIFPYDALKEPLKAYRTVIKEAPLTQLAQVATLRIGRFYLRNKNSKAAITVLRDFLEKYPSSALKNNAQILLAQAYFSEVRRYYEDRQYLLAIRSYAEFRTVVPNRLGPRAYPFKTMLEVGESYMNLGLYAQANKIFRKILAEPEGVFSVGEEVLFRLAQSNLIMGDRETAKELGRQYLKIFSKGKRSSSFQALMGKIEWLEGRYHSAVTLLRRALEGKLDAEVRGKALYLLSEAYARTGRYNEGIAAMKMAIVMYPSFRSRIKPFRLDQASYRMADMFYEGRRWVGAFLAYRDAMQKFPKSPNVGWAIRRMTELTERLSLTKRVGTFQKKLPKDFTNPFWREFSKDFRESLEWERKNRGKIEKLLKQRALN